MKIARRPRSRVAIRLPQRDYPFLHRFDPARYPPAYLRLGILEASVQAASIAYLKAKWRAVVAVTDVGAAKLRGQAAGLIRAAGGDPRRLKGRGDATTRGIVDVAATFPGGRAGWFEVKRPASFAPSPKTGSLIQIAEPGAPTDEQLEFLYQQHRQGALVGVIWAHLDLDAIVPAPPGPLRSYPVPELPPLNESVNGWDDAWGTKPCEISGGKDLTKGPA